MIINFLGYYAVWWSIVCFSKTNMEKIILSIFIINLIIHFSFNVKNVKREVLVLLSISSLGVMIDFLFHIIKVFYFTSNFYFWLPLIWITFSTTILHSTLKIFEQNYWVVFIVGGIAGPLSYYSASRFDLLIYPNSIGRVVIHSLCWGLFLISIKKIKGIICEIY